MTNTAKLEVLLSRIKPADREAAAAARRRLDSLAKPPGSLGALEDIAEQLAGITGEVRGSVRGKAVIILCADNGVVEEGVASAPQSVTRAQTLNFIRGVTGAAVLAHRADARLYVVDVGVNAVLTHPAILHKKVRPGTANIAKGPAMTREEAIQALLAGAEAAETAASDGCNLLGVGEMGIGNTTTSSAVLVALTGCPPDAAVGRGAGLDDAAFAKKKRVIAEAVALNAPNPADPLGVVAAVGGLDLAAMAGVYLAAAARRIPVVVDGFISAVAALLAAEMCPLAADFMIASHRSAEPGYRIAAERLGLRPTLDMRMRLGEGSGCPIAFSVVEFACAMMNEMATFEEAGIDDEYLDHLDETAFLTD